MKTQQYETGGRVYRITEHGDVYREDGVQLASCRGYMGSVSYFLGGRRVTIAPIVLELFVSPRPSRRHVAMHKDSCAWNNHHTNLRWGTHTERNLQGVKNQPIWYKLPSEPEKETIHDPRRKPVFVNGEWHASVLDAAVKLNLRADCISRAARSGRTHKGMTFEYINN